MKRYCKEFDTYYTNEYYESTVQKRIFYSILKATELMIVASVLKPGYSKVINFKSKNIPN